MSKIKMTQTIARILASRVAKEVNSALEAKSEKLSENVTKSKDFKQLVKLQSQIRSLTEESNLLARKLEKENSSSNVNVRVNTYRDETPRVYISKGVSVEAIAEDIMIKAHFADSKTTEEELIKEIVASYI